MWFDYYLHQNRSRVDNYFGRIGYPFKVSRFRFYLYKFLGYRATKVPAGTSISEVIVAAAIKSGAHPASYKVQHIRDTGADEQTIIKA